MQRVDDERMCMRRHTMRLEMRMIARQVFMAVDEHALIVRWPTPDRYEPPHHRKAAQSGQGNPEAELQTDPARQGIGQQPADVREGKLRGKHGRQVFLVR